MGWPIVMIAQALELAAEVLEVDIDVGPLGTRRVKQQAAPSLHCLRRNLG
jgi:hypothetical protein